MVKMKWVITDDLSNVSLTEFDYEWNGMIAGFFQLVVNGRKEGIYSERLITSGTMGLDEIVHWLSELYNGLNKVKMGEKYEVILLTMNVYKFCLELNEKLEISFVNKQTGEAKWKESVELQEFEDELYENIEKFLLYLKEINPQLLKSKWIKEMIPDNFEFCQI